MNIKQKLFDNKQRFSFRKLTVGLSSVLLGLTFMAIANTNQVHAAEQASTTQSAGTQTTENSDALEESLQPARKDIDAHIDGSHEAQDQAVSSLSDGHDRQDPNSKGESESADSNSGTSNTEENSTPKEFDTTSNKNGLSTTGDLESKITPNAETTTVATGSNTNNPADKAKEVQSQNSTKVKVRSKRAAVEAPVQDVINWDAVEYVKDAGGNVDITGWDIDKGGIDILLPNTWDFTQKGIISDGKQAEITAKVMSSITYASNIKAVDKTYSVKISENGDGKLIAKDQDWSSVFHDRTKLERANLNNLDTSNITSMNRMFAYTSGLQSLDVSNWDTHNVTDMSFMFADASLQSLDVSKWDTSNVTDMSNMFEEISLQSLDISNWDTHNVTDMFSMFFNASSLQNLDVSKWDTHNVTDMGWMFYQAYNLQSLDVSNWDTSNVTNMSRMFQQTSLQSLDVSNWDTHNVTGMMCMFFDAENLQNLDLSKWNTSKVTDMMGMFGETHNLESLDISNWDTHNATGTGVFSGSGMIGMFDGAGSANGLIITANNYQGNSVPGASDTKKLAIISNDKEAFTDVSTWGNRPKTLTVMVHDESTNTDHEEKVELDTIAYDSPAALRNTIREKLTAFTNSKTDKMHMAGYPILTSNPTNLAQELNATYRMNVKDASVSTSTYVIHWVYADDDPYADKSLAGQNVRDNANIVYLNSRGLPSLSVYGSGSDSADGYGSSVIRNDLADEGVVASISDKELNFVRLGFIKNIPAKSVVKNGKVYVARKAIAQNYYTSSAGSVPLDYDKETNTFSFSPDKNWPDASSYPENRENDIYIYYYRDLSQETLNIKVKYVDSDENDKVVTEQDLTGKLGDQVATPEPSENYIIDPSSSSVLLFDKEHVLDPDNNPYMVRLRHKKTISVLDTPAKRTITIHSPDGTVSTYVQTIGYKRDKITDLVTNDVTYGKYTFDDPTSSYTINGVAQTAKAYCQDGSKIYFASIEIPKIQGYKAVVVRNRGITTVSYKLLALPKQDLAVSGNVTDSKISVPVNNQSSAIQTPELIQQDNSIYYNIKKENLDIAVPKVKDYEFHLDTSLKNALAFTYTNGDNIYKFNLVLDQNGQLLLRVENKNISKQYTVKNKADLLNLIKLLIK